MFNDVGPLHVAAKNECTGDNFELIRHACRKCIADGFYAVCYTRKTEGSINDPKSKQLYTFVKSDTVRIIKPDKSSKLYLGSAALKVIELADKKLAAGYSVRTYYDSRCFDGSVTYLCTSQNPRTHDYSKIQYTITQEAKLSGLCIQMANNCILADIFPGYDVVPMPNKYHMRYRYNPDE